MKVILRRTLVLSTIAAALVVGLVSTSCGERRGAVADGTGSGAAPGQEAWCGTPNEGCPCTEPGRVVECGKVSHTGPDGWVACSMGHRSCVGSAWGTCVGETDITTKNLVPGAALHGLGLGSGVPCPSSGPLSNACDPYCNYFLDDGDGGIDGGGVVVVGEGGITIDPGAEGGVGGGSGFVAPQAGVSGCSPTTRNLDGSGVDCTLAPLTTCQQDFRCDPTTKRCLWNGNTAYYDPSVAGVDLTVEAPCGPSGSATTTAVVCNRGSATVASGAVIKLHETNGPGPPNGCTDLGATTFTTTLTAPLTKGHCTTVSIGNSPGAKYITVNAGLPGGPGAPSVAESAGRCANNSAYWRTDGAGSCAACDTCVTRLTGTIKDPRGVNPLPNVTVYVPTGALSALPVGPGCDSCSSLVSGTPWSIATTDYRGVFTLDVPAGARFPLVIQAGRWRRRLQVNAVTACTTATLDVSCTAAGCTQYDATTTAYTACSGAACSRLPAKTAEGEIPKMALVQAAGDQLECLLRKIGIDDTEFTVASGTGKVHLYSHNGMTALGSETAESALWGNAGTGAGAALNNYGAVISPCDNNHSPSGVGPSYATAIAPTASASMAQQNNMKSFADAGGRLFGTHWFSLDWVHTNYPTAVTHVFGGNVDNDRESTAPGGAFDFTIDTTTPTGTTFAKWLNYVGASPGGFGTLRFISWRHLPESVNTPTTIRLAYGDSRLAPISHPQNATTWGGPMVSVYQFDTPYASASPCGRVVMAQSHVSQYGTGSAFPGPCGSATNAMTAQEQSFEFMIFNSQACLGLVPSVPAATTPNLSTVTFARDYHAVCAPGFVAKWGPFYWQSTNPPNTQIDFRAATADVQASLPAAPGVPPTATSRAVGSASTTVVPPAWNCDGCAGTPVTVDYHLKTDVPAPNSASKEWLRIFMTFTPDNTASPKTSPELNAWRQVYDCVPNE